MNIAFQDSRKQCGVGIRGHCVRSSFTVQMLFILKEPFKFFFGLFFLGYHYYMVYCMDHLWKMLYSLLCSSSWVNLLFYLFVYLLTYFRVRSCCMAKTVLELTMVLRLALNLFVILLLLPPVL